MRLRVGFVFAVALAAACSSFSEDVPNGGAGGADAGAAGEAGSAADGSGGVVPDAAEGGVDAGEGFCESVGTDRLLCADFDEGQPVRTGFEILVGNVTLDTALSRSAPASMLARGAAGNSYLERTFTEKPADASAEIRFAVRLGDASGAGGNALAIPVRLLFEGSAAQCVFEIAVEGDNAKLTVKPGADAGAAKDYPLLHGLPFGTWAAFEMKLENTGAGTVQARVQIDGALARLTTTTCPKIGGPARLLLGMLYGVGEQARFDDVVFDVR